MWILDQRLREHWRDRGHAACQACAHRRGRTRRVGTRISGKHMVATKWLHRFVVLVALASPSAAAAQPSAPFFQGKTVSIFVGFAPGGGYDAYAHLLATHM